VSALLPLLVSLAWAATAPTGAEARRIAILVGANDAPAGRAPLRFSYKDAKEMADVLIQAGQFAPGDVHVLEDPEPAAVLAALDGALATLGESPTATMLLFYYSGHADDGALYPHGEPLPVASLKERLESGSASVRVGILDSCSGGGWTQAKGLQPDKPFTVTVPLALTSEGSALIASSSGLESAHESETLQGSFFTHHFVAGLRGAADRSGDGEVTLGEAFAYAQERTIRDSAEQANSPQHPSFDIHLRGRQDLALTRIATSDSLVVLDESQGPLQIIQLQTGLVVLEIPPGERTLKLALPPGHYLVQRHSGGKTFAQEIEVGSGTTQLEEDGLTLVATPQPSGKGLSPPLTLNSGTGIPAGHVDLSLVGGVYHNDPNPLMGIVSSGPNFVWGVSAIWGITDRLEWYIGMPALAYRFGDRGGLEWIPYGGIINWGPQVSSNGFGLNYQLAAGLNTRYWLGNTRFISTNLSTFSNTATVPVSGQVSGSSPDTWAGSAAVSFSQRLKDIVTLSIGVSWTENYIYEGGLPGPSTSGAELGVGSVSHPLVSVRVLRRMSLDGYATVYFDTHGDVEESYLLGVTFRL
jgi:hypothetical protein